MNISIIDMISATCLVEYIFTRYLYCNIQRAELKLYISNFNDSYTHSFTIPY